MFVGHLGAAMALKKGDRRLNAGVLVFTALWFDIALWLRNSGSAAVVGLAVFSNFVLDWIEHPPETPLAGSSSMKVGLAMWDHLGIALGLELALVVIGLGLYLAAAQDVSRAGRSESPSSWDSSRSWPSAGSGPRGRRHPLLSPRSVR
jgi:hypothetical protein